MYTIRKVMFAIILASSALAQSINGAEQTEGEHTIATALLSGLTLFRFDSAQLTDEGHRAVKKLVDDLSQFHAIQSIRVVGHTDSRGSEIYNLQLSKRRAAHIQEILQKSYPQVNLISIGAGESTPIASNDLVEGRRLNRRVEIEIVAKGIRQLTR